MTVEHGLVGQPSLWVHELEVAALFITAQQVLHWVDAVKLQFFRLLWQCSGEQSTCAAEEVGPEGTTCKLTQHKVRSKTVVDNSSVGNGSGKRNNSK